jgi:hypothetical protein
VKVGDLIRIISTGEVGVVTRFISFERGKNPQPVVLIDATLRVCGHFACEVISEDG